MTVLLECKELTHHYEDPLHHQAGVFDVSFTLKKGHKLGLVGESGSGKSTIAKILSRLLDLQEGSIQFLGQSLTTYSDLDFYKRVQYISQLPQDAFHPKRTLQASLEEVNGRAYPTTYRKSRIASRPCSTISPPIKWRRMSTDGYSQGSLGPARLIDL